MKLIEKKCPNCGASLEFSETAKSCKCDYCHRTFEIERDNNGINIDFNLSELEAPAKAISKVFIIISIIFAVIFVSVAVIIGISINNSSKDFDNFVNNGNSKEKINGKSEEEVVASNINDIDNSSLKLLENEASSFNKAKGESSTKYSYQSKDEQVYKYILAYKDKKNYVFVVQKVLYINFFNNNDRKTAYIPVKYENVYSKLDQFEDSTENIIDGAKVDAPEFYLNDEKTSFIRGGYADYNQFVEEKINTLKNDGYKISEK